MTLCMRVTESRKHDGTMPMFVGADELVHASTGWTEWASAGPGLGGMVGPFSSAGFFCRVLSDAGLLTPHFDLSLRAGRLAFVASIRPVFVTQANVCCGSCCPPHDPGDKSARKKGTVWMWSDHGIKYQKSAWLCENFYFAVLHGHVVHHVEREISFVASEWR